LNTPRKQAFLGRQKFSRYFALSFRVRGRNWQLTQISEHSPKVTHDWLLSAI